MPWLDDLKRLRVRVDNEGYGRRMTQAADRRGLLEKFASELSVDEMLTQLNDVLLDGGARLIINRSWQYEFEEEELSDEDDVDEIVYVLYWHDGEPVEIEVRVGIDEEESGYVLVDDEEIDDDSDAIQEALLDAFRDIADIVED